MARYISLLILLFPVLSNAQYQVRGSVVKADGSPVISMAVVLKKQGNAGFNGAVVSDSVGAFSFVVPDPGIYELKLQSLFYRDTAIVITFLPADREKNIGAIKV